MKRVLVMFAIILMLGMSELAFAQNDLDIENINIEVIDIIIGYKADIEGNPLYFTYLTSDVSSYIVDGITMIPLRALTEGFGFDVDYQEKDRTITIKDAKGKNELVFTVDSTTVMRNGQADILQQAPVIHMNRTFIPLRYVSEFFLRHVSWKKSLDGKRMFIWVSAVQLLTEDDVAVENDDNYYCKPVSPTDPMPYYVLKNSGQTYRGIRIGDDYKKVVEVYGEPHVKNHMDGILVSIRYRTEAYPNDDPGSVLTFYFINGLVDYVGIDGK